MSVNNIGCELAAGWNLNCKSVSGIRAIYLIPAIYIVSTAATIFNTVVDNKYFFDANDKITGITYSNNKKFYQISITPESASYEEKEVFDGKTGSFYWDGNLSFQIGSMSSTSRKEFLQMLGEPLIAAYQDNSGKCFLVGKNNFLRATGNLTSGLQFGSFNGISINLQSAEPFPHYELTPSVIGVSSISVTSTSSGTSLPVVDSSQSS